MENFFGNLFEDVKREGSLIFKLSKTEEGFLRQSGFTDLDIKIERKLASEKLQTEH